MKKSIILWNSFLTSQATGSNIAHNKNINRALARASNTGYLTIASVHSLQSLEQAYGRISLRSKAAPIKFPVMWGVSEQCKL